MKDIDFIEVGRRIAAREADFFWGAARSDQLPPLRDLQQGGLEIACAGRSNVGKSSLINAFTGRNSLARTSHTPGRTQELNFFNIADAFTLVDMPGYGFAAASKSKVSAWTGMIHDYLRGRTHLARIFLLIDARHGMKETDLAILETLDKSAVSFQVVLTKIDQVSAADLEKCEQNTRTRLRKNAAAHPEILLTSSHKNIGIETLRASVARLLYDRNALPDWAIKP